MEREHKKTDWTAHCRPSPVSYFSYSDFFGQVDIPYKPQPFFGKRDCPPSGINLVPSPAKMRGLLARVVVRMPEFSSGDKSEYAKEAPEREIPRILGFQYLPGFAYGGGAKDMTQRIDAPDDVPHENNSEKSREEYAVPSGERVGKNKSRKRKPPVVFLLPKK